MTPDFTLLLVGGIVFAVAVLVFIGWRFGGPDTLAFSIVSGGFTAVMDFLSAFVMRNYEYPGQSPLWVFTGAGRIIRPARRSTRRSASTSNP